MYRPFFVDNKANCYVSSDFTRVSYNPNLHSVTCTNRAEGWYEVRDCPFGVVGDKHEVAGKNFMAVISDIEIVKRREYSGDTKWYWKLTLVKE